MGSSDRSDLAALRPQGVIPPCLTFFDDDGAIDDRRIKHHIDWLVNAGVNGLLGIGTCGEFATLDPDERERLAEVIVESCASRVPVYIGVMSTSTRTAIRLARQAEAIGAAGIVSVAPYYSSPPEREVLTYFRDVAAAVAIPLIIYNNPPASGVSLSVPTLAKLAADGVAAGIKDSHGDAARIHDLRLLCPPETAILYGEDYGSLEAILAGADGWTAGVANFMPRHAVELWRLAHSGDVEAARDHWARILSLVNMTSNKVMFGRPDERPDFIQIYKAALDIMGMAGGASRRPLLPLPDEDLLHLRGLVSELDLSPSVA
jgi:4-hydroxy-tetrahydrodipicolinate synthase